MDMKFQSPYLSPNQARMLLANRYKELTNDNVVDITDKLKQKGVML